MLQQAKWIGCGDAVSPYIHKTFSLHRPETGILEVTGLGFFELWINGKPVSDELHNPTPSQYGPRDLSKFSYPIHDELTLRIYYRRYDISALLADGENQITLLLGNGWYRQYERVGEGMAAYGEELKAIFALEVKDADGLQTVVSDGSEIYTNSHIAYSNLYIGEVQDARLLGVLGERRPVSVLPNCEAELTLQECPSDRVIRRIQPKLIYIDGARKVYDAGENITGRVALEVSAADGQEVTLRFSEEIEKNYDLNFTSTGSYCQCGSGRMQIQQDTFIGDGRIHRMKPEFVWHCFRYFEIIGEADAPVVEVIHTDIAVTSSFDSDCEALNWLYDAYIRTQLDNFHGSVPSDCPHRERLGYLGDGQVTAPAAMLLLDTDTAFRKWMQDILDGQDKSSGHTQHTAPFMGGGGGPGGWGGAVVIVPYRHYRQFGDLAWIRGIYPAMVKWISYMESRREDGLIVREEEGGWCLGDWASAGNMHLPQPFANTCYYADCLQKLSYLANQLGETRDAERFTKLAESCREAVKRHYYDPQTGSYCKGIQGADAHVLYIGMDEDKRTLENLDARYQALGYFDTGFIGTDWLCEVLFRYGKEETAMKLLTNEQEGGFLWMKRIGATTIWEYLSRQFGLGCSHCHPMFGGAVRQLFTHILGITQPENAAGYREVVIAPHFVPGLSYARGTVMLHGKELGVSWAWDEDAVRLNIMVPDGIKATFAYHGHSRKLESGVNEMVLI